MKQTKEKKVKKRKGVLGGLTFANVTKLTEAEARKLIEFAEDDELAAAMVVASVVPVEHCDALERRGAEQNSLCQKFVANSLFNAECRQAGAKVLAQLWHRVEMRSVCYAALQLVQKELKCAGEKNSDGLALFALDALLSIASNVCVEAHETWLERAADNALAVLPVKSDLKCVPSPKSLAFKCIELANRNNLLVSAKAAVACVLKKSDPALQILIRRAKILNDKEVLPLLYKLLQQKVPRRQEDVSEMILMAPPSDQDEQKTICASLLAAVSALAEIAVTMEADSVDGIPERLISLSKHIDNEKLRQALISAAAFIVETHPIKNLTFTTDEKLYESCSWLVLALRNGHIDDNAERKVLISATIQALSSNANDRHMVLLLASGLTRLLDHVEKSQTLRILLQATLEIESNDARENLAKAATLLLPKPKVIDNKDEYFWISMVESALDRRDDSAKHIRLSALTLASSFAIYFPTQIAKLLLWPRERRRRIFGGQSLKEQQAAVAALRASWPGLSPQFGLLLLYENSFAAQPPGAFQVFYNLERGRTIQSKSREAEAERRTGISCLRAAILECKNTPLLKVTLAGLVARLGLSVHPCARELFEPWLSHETDTIDALQLLLEASSDEWKALRSLALATPIMRTSLRDEKCLAAAATCVSKARPLVESVIQDFVSLLDTSESFGLIAAVAAATIGLLGHIQCSVNEETRLRAQYIVDLLISRTAEQHNFNVDYESPAFNLSLLRDLTTELQVTLRCPDGGALF